MRETLVWLPVLVSVVSVAIAAVAVFLLMRVSSTIESARRELRDESRAGREEARSAGRELRESQQTQMDAMARQLEKLHDTQEKRLGESFRLVQQLTESNQGALDRIRGTLDTRVKELQDRNEAKLDEMRKTVDEKLHDTLEKRLGESFRLVSDRLDAVHQGLGEMHNLVTGVGDLKRVLTNVKVRGTWAEVQLGAILQEILTPGQYEKNVRVKADLFESVEYAVRLPGAKEDPDGCVWLPIDSKFPQEDYLRLQEAAEKADSELVQKAVDALARVIRTCAKDIHDKYVNPPRTTDFAIMFLATEGLYAEVLRQPALVEDLLSRYRVVVAGPTTLAAILSSLRLGFQTLAIEQRAAEVWKILRAVKTEFGKFGEVLTKVKRQLDRASLTIEDTGVRTRAITRTLRSVEQLPDDEATRILELPAAETEVEPDEPDVEKVYLFGQH
jgi:DNA recombination protein RmuC